MEANQPQQAISFFIKLFWFEDEVNVEGCVLDNMHTGERLVITEYDLNADFFSITRHPIGASQEWIEQMGNEEPDGDYRKIQIEV